MPTCDLFGSVQDVWFSFITTTEGTVDCTVSIGTITSVNFNVHSGVCCALRPMLNACNSNLIASTIVSLTGLIASEAYYVQVWNNFAEWGTFNLRLSNPALETSNLILLLFKYIQIL